MSTVVVARTNHVANDEIVLGEMVGMGPIFVRRSRAPVIAPFGQSASSPELPRAHRRRGPGAVKE
jgi:hypothetical protein